MPSNVLVTGVSGFLAQHIITALAKEDEKYVIYGTMRKPDLIADAKERYSKDSAKKDDEIEKIAKMTKEERKEAIYEVAQKHLQKIYPEDIADKIRIRFLDLKQEADFKGVCADMNYVLHVASTFPNGEVSDELTEIITPESNSAKFMMKAAIDSKVKRVIYTSSTGALVDYPKGNGTQDETDHPSNADDLLAYSRGKIAAEKAITDTYEEQKEKKTELVIFCPGAMTGPALSKIDNYTLKFFSNIMTGEISTLPQVYLQLVDVRDVAQAHISAITKGKTGDRIALVEDTYKLATIGEKLQKKFGDKGFTPTTAESCLATFWMSSFFNDADKASYVAWNVEIKVNNKKSTDTLDVNYTKIDESLEDMGNSFIKHKMVKYDPPKKDEDEKSQHGKDEEVKKNDTKEKKK